MNHADKKILIIGGGVAGTSAAAYALEKGFQNVTIIESTEALGGLHKDVEINGLHYDIGAFFFHEKHNLVKLFPELKSIMIPAESVKQLSLTGKFNIDVYPLTLTQYLKENPVTITIYDLIKLFIYRCSHSVSNCRNVDELLTYYMGFFYTKSGLRNYIRRLYNTDPKNVNLEFTEKRMANVIEKFKTKSIWRSIIRFKWKDLVRYKIDGHALARPESGFSAMYDCIASVLKKRSCNIYFAESVVKIHTNEKRIQTHSGKVFEYDYLVSSMPLSAAASMSAIPFNGSLKHKALCSLFYEMPNEAMRDCFVLYNFSDKGSWKRITFHSAYYNRIHSDKNNHRYYFVVETMPDDKEIDNAGIAEQLDQDFKHSFLNTKWAGIFNQAILVGHHITKNAYPVLDLNFKREQVSAFKAKMREQNIYLVGRQGEFDYVASSDSSVAAVNAINNILHQWG